MPYDYGFGNTRTGPSSDGSNLQRQDLTENRVPVHDTDTYAKAYDVNLVCKVLNIFPEEFRAFLPESGLMALLTDCFTIVFTPNIAKVPSTLLVLNIAFSFFVSEA